MKSEPGLSLSPAPVAFAFLRVAAAAVPPGCCCVPGAGQCRQGMQRWEMRDARSHMPVGTDRILLAATAA